MSTVSSREVPASLPGTTAHTLYATRSCQSIRPHSPTSTAPSTNRRRSRCPAAPSTQKRGTSNGARTYLPCAWCVVAESAATNTTARAPNDAAFSQASPLAKSSTTTRPATSCPLKSPQSPSPPQIADARNPSGGTVEVRAPFGHTAYRGTDSSSHSNRPPRSIGTTTAKESRRVASPNACNCPSTYSAARALPG